MQRGIDAKKRYGNHAPKPSLHMASVGPIVDKAADERNEKKTGTSCMLGNCGERHNDLQICTATGGIAPL